MDFAALIYHRQAFLDGQWWLPLTAQWAHFSATHALANAAGAVLLGVLFRSWLRPPQQALAWGGGVLGVAVVLILDTQCSYYAGASGALHGWAAGGALWAALDVPKKQGHQARWAWALLLGIAVKLVWQLIYPPQTQDWGFPVYQPAHWAGAAGGIAGVLLWRSARALR
ncbi:rhombosortase [Rhodoferax bucti]|uniref:rhombosortase n=1 Tax=Rhodoferax bucti TaxID=2576305 RepID=UPI00110938FB|nr:rhombosortase [Rhodoferax bucti]